MPPLGARQTDIPNMEVLFVYVSEFCLFVGGACAPYLATDIRAQQQS